MHKHQQLLENLKTTLPKLEKAQARLQEIYQDCLPYHNIEQLTEEQSRRFEVFSSRFARLSDLLTQKIFRLIDILDLEDEGSIYDRLNRAEKKHLIDSAEKFIAIRYLRNHIAHEYEDDDSSLFSLYQDLLQYTPELLNTYNRIVEYIKKYS